MYAIGSNSAKSSAAISRRKMAEELDYIPIPVVKLIENTWPVEIKS